MIPARHGALEAPEDAAQVAGTYGCAVVLDDGHVAGVLTTVDPARVLSETLRQRHHG